MLAESENNKTERFVARDWLVGFFSRDKPCVISVVVVVVGGRRYAASPRLASSHLLGHEG